MNVGKEIKIGLILTIIFIVVVIIFMPRNLPTTGTSTNTPQTAYSINDVAKHNNQNDCWLIISNNVYSATNYLSIHPGGAQRIIPYCGQDATVAFNTNPRHDSRATTELATLKIGSLK
jgi:cytochrome b involved in lipid metabolism